MRQLDLFRDWEPEAEPKPMAEIVDIIDLLIARELRGGTLPPPRSPAPILPFERRRTA